MDLQIRPVCENDVEDLVQLSLAAWLPVFTSFEQILGPKIYAILYPGWEQRQRAAVEKVCKEAEKTLVWVAELAGKVRGFVAWELHEDQTGEVQLIAVHPDYQSHGVGAELNKLALAKMKASGVKLAVVGTGGDESHAPARRSYEKAGYTALPLVRYYKDL